MYNNLNKDKNRLREDEVQYDDFGAFLT